LKLEIGEKQKLAQAEARVNQNTLQLINSMNKFSSTAVDAVNALSADAVKLQSRNFEKLPAFAPQQQQQLGLEKLQADLSAAYQRARDVAEAFNQEAGKRKTEAENQKASLEAQMAGFMQKVETHTADLAKNFGPIQASLQDLAHKMSSLKPEEVEKRLRSIEGALKNFGAVTF
jgi:chromosome segregation ATPase